MEFSLKKYITEKYLTEKLQSDTLVHEILNDKGKMFTFYKMAYPGTMYYKALLCFDKLCKIISEVFTTNGQLQWRVNHMGEAIDTEEKLIALHKQYMQIYNDYINYTSKLFIKPDPQILSALSNNNIANYTGSFEKTRRDLSNITDEHFEKYVFNEVKGNAEKKLQISDDIDRCVVFWFSADRKILTVSVKGLMVLFSIDNEMIESKQGRRWPVLVHLDEERILDAVKKENLTISTIDRTLTDGTVLTWPIVHREYFVRGLLKSTGLDFVNDYLRLDKKCDMSKIQKVGAFFSKSSKLQKLTDWGKSPNDYLIIYKPELSLTNSKGETISTYNNGTRTMTSDMLSSYNDAKINTAYNNVKRQRYDDYMSIKEETYKWVKDILGKYKPYLGGKHNEYFEYGKKLSLYDILCLYETDNLCQRIVSENIKRYNLLIAQSKSLKNIRVFNEEIKPLIATIKQFILTGKSFNERIKTVYTQNVDQFTSLITLYGVYMKLTNTGLSVYGEILEKLGNLQKKLKSTDDDSSIILTNKLIRYDIDTLSNICNEISEFSVKIESTLNS